ncbi:hypothetical protein TNCV_3899741 [Trichonephila clavipes]|nr:hypothetical protein TNCV_3899741 [Trichonephila clavipes]
MSSGNSLPHFNLSVQCGTQGVPVKEALTENSLVGSINNIGREDWDTCRRFTDRSRDGNWWDAGVINRQNDMTMANGESNGLRSRGLVDNDNQCFERRHWNDRNDYGLNNRGSRNNFINKDSSNNWTKRIEEILET